MSRRRESVRICRPASLRPPSGRPPVSAWCGLVGAAVLWWYCCRLVVVRPPSRSRSARPATSRTSSIRYGSTWSRFTDHDWTGRWWPLFGAAIGALVSMTGWNLVPRERTRVCNQIMRLSLDWRSCRGIRGRSAGPTWRRRWVRGRGRGRREPPGRSGARQQPVGLHEPAHDSEGSSVRWPLGFATQAPTSILAAPPAPSTFPTVVGRPSRPGSPHSSGDER